MAIFIKNSRYNGVVIFLHWVIAVLVIFMLWFGHYMHHLPKGSIERLEAFQLHYSIGITILVLSVLRVIWRFFKKAPPLATTMQTWQKALAKTVHYLFYILLILLPLAGWATATTSPLDVPIIYFDLFQWPWFPGLKGAPDQEYLNRIFEEMHVYLGRAVLGLLILHVLATLYHTVLLRDGTLKRILPGK